MSLLDVAVTTPPIPDLVGRSTLAPARRPVRGAGHLVASVEDPDPLMALVEGFGFVESPSFDGQHATPTAHNLAAQGLVALGFLGLLELERGQLQAAEALADQGLQIARHRGWTELPQTLMINLVLAMVRLERHQLAEAEELLHPRPAAKRADPEAALHLALHVTQARLLLAQGRHERAEAVLAGARASADTLNAPALVRHWLAVTESELDLAAGRPRAACERARFVRRDTAGAGERFSVVTARAELALGNGAEVQAILAPVQDSSTNAVACVEAWLVTALAADHERNDHEALAALDRALTLAEPLGVRRPFLTFRRRRVAAMLGHRQRLTFERRPFVEDLLAALDTSDAVSVPTVPLASPLTRREQTVLRHLASMQTNEDIGADLYITVNTVKAHAKAVYQKLGVSNRRDAVTRARHLGLL